MTTHARLGILGGTFDPIHYGHLLLAEQAREQLGLCAVQFIPSARPPHKLLDPVTDAEHRFHMCALATADNPAFEVSRRELDRPGPSYTIVTLRELRDEGHDQVFFITGADTVLEMGTWREPEAILRDFVVVAAARPSFDLSQLGTALGPALASLVTVIEVPEQAISSTDIRGRVATGRSVRYLTPDPVAQHIADAGLYSANTEALPARTPALEH